MRTTNNLQRSLRYLLAWAPTMALPTLGAQRPMRAATLPSGTLSFFGRATVGDFVGTTTRVTGAIIGGPDYSAARGWVDAPVGTLVTGNDRRDRDLRATMNVERYPIMHFELTSATLVAKSVDERDSTGLLLHGALTIHGVTRRVEVPATVLRNGDTTRVSSRFRLDLFDYDIHGLTRMFGVLRMQHEIDVRVDLQFVDRPIFSANP